MQKLTIPGELSDLNTIIDASKRHWAKYHAFKKQYTEAVAMVAKSQLKPVSEYPVQLLIDWYSKDRRKDPDNIAAETKFILDGLVLAGILKGDGWKYITELHDRFCLDQKKPRVEVFLVDQYVTFNGVKTPLK